MIQIVHERNKEILRTFILGGIYRHHDYIHPHSLCVVKMTYFLWFDDSKDPMTKKAQRVLEYYEKKYGRPPSILESSVKDEPVEGLRIVTRRVSLPKFHFLLGEE